MRYFNLSLVCCSILLAFSHTCYADVVLDAGFEDASSESFWTTVGTALADAVAPGIDPSEGTEVLQLIGAGDAPFSIAFQDVAVDGAAIRVGDQVAVSGILGQISNDQLGGLNNAFLEVSFVDASNVEFMDSLFQSARLDANSPSDVYLSSVTTFATVPSNAVSVRVKAVFEELSAGVVARSGSAFVDNVELVVISVPEPSSGLVLATGLLNLLIRRRR